MFSPTPCKQRLARWVERVAAREFADELVVAAVAHHLHIHIVVVPYTPADASVNWKITEYSQTIELGRTVFLGNNDVHYVWISASN